MALELPNSFAELISNPAKLREAFALLQRLERLRIVREDGIVVPIKFSESDAVLDFKTPEAAPAEELPAEADALDPETIVWRDAALAAGATFETDSMDIADALIRAIKAASYGSKIK